MPQNVEVSIDGANGVYSGGRTAAKGQLLERGGGERHRTDVQIHAIGVQSHIECTRAGDVSDGDGVAVAACEIDGRRLPDQNAQVAQRQCSANAGTRELVGVDGVGSSAVVAESADGAAGR